MGKNLRCDFAISVEEMLDDDVNVLLDGVIVAIEKVSAVLCISSCDNFLS